MTDQSPKLILIPGLGTDERLFERQRAAFSDLWVPPWIVPRDGEGLPEYAVRLAEMIRQRHTEPIVLGGVSLGGMLAYEVARHIKPQAVILIASCHTRRGIRGFFRACGHIWPVMPSGVFRIVKFASVPALRMFGPMMPEHRRLCAEMFSRSDAHFMHWAISAILNWNPLPLAETPVFQLHGIHDRIIPLKCVEPDKILPHGGHLINITHADEVNAYIKDIIAKLQFA
jgi:pimeloyl-ACP methyl ester carboxylesterase